jgi:hypothetical protein
VADNSSEKLEYRLKRFRLLAVKARESAGKASSPSERDEFLKIAKDWEAMAKALEGGVRDQRP